jgi:hypothetical protein
MPRLSGQRMRVQPSAQRDHSDTNKHSATRATQLHSPATAGGGPAQGGTCVCRHRRDVIAATQARTVPLARRDCPPQPRPVEGPPPSARRDRSDTSTHRAARVTRPPSPATAGGGHKPTPVEGTNPRQVEGTNPWYKPKHCSYIKGHPRFRVCTW